MADTELALMTPASTLDGSELTYALQGGADRKATVAQIRAGLLPLVGGAMSGDLVLAGAPTQALHPASKTYVDSGLAGKAASAHTHSPADLTSAVPPTKGGTGLTTLGSPLQVVRTNAAGDAFEHADPSGGGLSGLTTGNIPYADSTTTLAEGPIYRCAPARIGFGGITDSFPGMRWAGTIIDFVTAAAGAFIAINVFYLQLANATKLKNSSDGVAMFTNSVDVLGGIEVGTLIWNDGTQWTVTLGGNDSGGTGKRALVVDNV